MKQIIFLLFLFSLKFSQAQPTFIKSLSRDTLEIDMGGSCKGVDSTYFLYGACESILSVYYNTLFVIKFDQNDDTLWSVIIDSLEFVPMNEYSSNILTPTNDGGCAIISTSLHQDVIFLKLDSNGNKEFTKKFGTTNLSHVSKIIQTRDFGYILLYVDIQCCLNSFSYNQLIKLDSNGNELWKRRYGMHVNSSDIIEDVFGNLFMLGGQNQLVKLNSEGTALWDISFHYNSPYYPSFMEIIGLRNSKIFLSGHSIYDTGIVMIVDTNGNFLNSIRIEKHQITDTDFGSDGNLLLTLHAFNSDSLSILKLDSLLQPIYCKRIPHRGLLSGNYFTMTSTTELNDASILISGIYRDTLLYDQRGFIIKLNTSEPLQCTGYPGTLTIQPISFTTIYSATPDTGASYVLAQSFTNITYDVMHGLEFQLECLATNIENLKEENDYAVYPNPTSETILVDGYMKNNTSIRLYDLTGKCILFEKEVSIPHKINLTEFPKGMYFIMISNLSEIETHKIILE